MTGVVDSREIVLKLVRVAMGWECDYSLPGSVDWAEVFNVAYNQMVLAIVTDGFEICCQHNPELKNNADSTDGEDDIITRAMSVAYLTELNYYRHLSALTQLSQAISTKDIPFMLMKGFACGRHYPNPKRRQCGDIDIYPGDRYNESNEALKAAGIEVSPYYYRHSASVIERVCIENHKVLGDLRGPRRQTRDFEVTLEAEAKKSIQNGEAVVLEGDEIPGARYPSADFNALFMPWHVSAHFAFENVTVRHLLDWALFLVHEGKDIDLQKLREAKQKYSYGYSKFVDILTALSVKYLKMPADKVPHEILEDSVNVDQRLAEKVFDYMFTGSPKEHDESTWQSRVHNVGRVWRDRWKYKELYGISFARFLYYKTIGVLFKVGDD